MIELSIRSFIVESYGLVVMDVIVRFDQTRDILHHKVKQV